MTVQRQISASPKNYTLFDKAGEIAQFWCWDIARAALRIWTAEGGKDLLVQVNRTGEVYSPTTARRFL